MKLIALRTYFSNRTQSILLVELDGMLFWSGVWLELPWLDNQTDKSCIKPGVYTCAKMSNGSGKIRFSIRNVPGRTNVQIHAGNFVSGNKIDSKGCPLPGMFFDDINSDGCPDVVDSVHAMEELNSILPNVFQLHILELNPEFFN